MEVELLTDYTIPFTQHKVLKGETIEVEDTFPWSGHYVYRAQSEESMMACCLIKKDVCKAVE